MEYLVELHVKYGDSVLSTCNYEYKEWQEQGLVGGCLGGSPFLAGGWIDVLTLVLLH